MKQITKQQLEELYINENLSSTDIAKKLSTNKKMILHKLKEFEITKPKEMIYSSRTKKTKETNMKKYGVEGYNNRNKAKQTLLNKYGVENISQLEYVKLKKELTCFENFGVRFPSQTESWHEKVKKTNLEKYGYEWFMSSPKFWEKIDKETWLKHQHESKRKNKSFKTSKIEDEYYNYLLKFFNSCDIIRQYKEERYPFNCDFYIVPIDTFIELNIHWTHGIKPYDKNDIECIEILKEWNNKAKTSKYVSNAINTWTVRDVEKLKIAKENKLNYICIYNKEELYEVNFNNVRIR